MTAAGDLHADPSSFRDPANEVHVGPDRVVRFLTTEGLDSWRSVKASSAFGRALESGWIVGTRELDDVAGGRWAGALEHTRVPFVSYPYEWPFSMLRDAALLELELLAALLEDDLVLKDGTPFNVQWRGTAPTFIDVGSIEPWRGEPWMGYAQFCAHALNPLLLTALLGVDYQPWLRGALDGIAPGELNALLPLRKRVRSGVRSHVALHARMTRRSRGPSQDTVQQLRSAGFSKRALQGTIAGLERLVRSLEADLRTPWLDYTETQPYAPADAEAKLAFVRAAAAERRVRLAWDLGCNDGRYARALAEHANAVVAIDSDHGVVDRLYRDLKADRDERILPLVVDLADPSPARGWRGRERADLETRGRPEIVLALALVHHLSISGGVPLAGVVDWLAAMGAVTVVEFVDPEDPMAAALLAGKRPGLHADYTRPEFERLLDAAFETVRREELPSGRRTLYLVTPRGR